MNCVKDIQTAINLLGVLLLNIDYCLTVKSRLAWLRVVFTINTSVVRDRIKCSCVHVSNDHFVRRNEEERKRGEKGRRTTNDKRTNAREVANTHNKFA